MTAIPLDSRKPRPLAVGLDTACEMLGIGRTKMRELFDAGEIVPRRLGKRVLIRVADLEQFLNNLPTADAAGKAGAAK